VSGGSDPGDLRAAITSGTAGSVGWNTIARNARPPANPVAIHLALAEALDSVLTRIEPVRVIRGNGCCSNAAAASICGQQFGQMRS
jgi:hypothetical protein